MVLVSLAASIVSNMLSGLFHGDTAAIHCRSNTLTARHDTNRSGWWQLIVLVPVIGWIVLLVFLAQEGKE